MTEIQFDLWQILGEWMNNSAGIAFTPHVIHVAPGEVCLSLKLLCDTALDVFS